jgi:hypothetical protein
VIVKEAHKIVHLIFSGLFWGILGWGFFVECPKRCEEEGSGDGLFSLWGAW